MKKHNALSNLVTINFISKPDAAEMKMQSGWYVSLNDAKGDAITAERCLSKKHAEKMRAHMLEAIKERITAARGA